MIKKAFSFCLLLGIAASGYATIQFSVYNGSNEAIQFKTDTLDSITVPQTAFAPGSYTLANKGTLTILDTQTNLPSLVLLGKGETKTPKNGKGSEQIQAQKFKIYTTSAHLPRGCLYFSKKDPQQSGDLAFVLVYRSPHQFTIKLGENTVYHETDHCE